MAKLTGNEEYSFIPEHGGYHKLQTYKKAMIIYDGTVYFCKRFFNPRDRTVDQMVQAARSGKQNIVEGSVAAATSKETEIKLTNVARASLEELLNDYQDFIRTNHYQEWDKNHKYYKRMKELLNNSEANYETFRRGIENDNPEICANIMINLIRVTTYLLYKQICKLEELFIKEGGVRERMFKARIEERNRTK